MRRYLPRSWVSPKLRPGRSSIHGVGVIASVAIAKGETLMEFGGQPITRADFESDTYRARSIWLAAGEQFLALPKSDPEPSLDENLNHSCDANCWLDDEVTLSARRNIGAGEEITLDQGTWNFDEEEYVWDQDHCTCGASACRKTLTHEDWRRDDVQERYRGHFHPHVQRMIDGQRKAIAIRPRDPDDDEAIHSVVMAAFGQSGEADLVRAVEGAGDSVIALVAVKDGTLVGHVLLSRMTAPFRALALAPVSVAPDSQNGGIGSALVREAIARARQDGWEAIFVLGEPRYYQRFGFDIEAASGFTSPYAGPHFMALALGARLPERTGALTHAAAFGGLD